MSRRESIVQSGVSATRSCVVRPATCDHCLRQRRVTWVAPRTRYHGRRRADRAPLTSEHRLVRPARCRTECHWSMRPRAVVG